MEMERRTSKIVNANILALDARDQRIRLIPEKLDARDRF
jgi:hypothetical protein